MKSAHNKAKLVSEIEVRLGQIRKLVDELAQEYVYVRQQLVGDESDKVMHMVAAAFGMVKSEMCSRSQRPRIVLARQAAHYVLREGLQVSYPEIALVTGLSDHTTVMHSCRKIAGKRLESRDFDKTIQRLIDAVMTGKHRAA